MSVQKTYPQKQRDVSPAYSPTDAETFAYGLTAGTAGQIMTVNSGTESWLLFLCPLWLDTPQTITLKSVTACLAYTSSTDCDSVIVGIWETGTGSNRDLVASVDITAKSGVQADNNHLIDADLGDEQVTLEFGKEYWWGFAIRGHATHRDNKPYMRYARSGPTGAERYRVDQHDLPATIDNGDLLAGNQYHIHGELTFETAGCELYKSGDIAVAFHVSGTTKRMIPVCTSHPGYVKLENLFVEDGNDVSAILADVDNDGNEDVIDTATLDMGATDQVTFHSQNVALAGAGAEAGDRFDLLVNWISADDEMDLLWVNRTDGQGGDGDYDIVTMSHAAITQSARDTRYSISRPHYVTISGTGTLRTFCVGTRICCYLGDSQTAVRGGGDENPVIPYRLGAEFPDAFTHARTCWHGGIGGNKLTESTYGIAGYLRYKNDTIGLGDICEIRGMTFVFAGMGINDIRLLINTEDNRNKIIGTMLYRVAGMIQDVLANGNEAIIMGLPPCSASIVEAEAQAIRQLNAGLHGLAKGMRVPFYNAWWEMLDRSTINDAVPDWRSDYAGDDTHYDNTLAATAAEGAASVYERGYNFDRERF